LNFKFTKIDLLEFTKFSDVKFEFVSGINVFIGKNGTGKTHLLKLLYTIAVANNKVYTLKERKIFSEIISEKLKGVFKISELSHLFRSSEKKKENKKSEEESNKSFDYTINYYLEENQNGLFIQYVNAKDKIESAQDNSDKLIKYFPENIVYLPTQEVLTTYQDINRLKNVKTEFDETLFDLAESFVNKFIPKEKNEFQKKMFALIEEHLGGELIKEKDTFYIKYSHGKIEATLLAEGIKKLATLYYLIENGTITENSILIWDEPEIYFNPKLITILTKILNELAVSGVQIFLATHDYLLTHQLSLLDEYRDSIENNTASIKFFCLEDSKEEGVKVFSGTNLTHIQNNPILEEFASHYDRERELFERSMNRG
jgi:predicted ATP-dependent endonuclease of OLD family